MNRFAIASLSLLALLSMMVAPAQADVARRAPGSVLIYPVYVSTGGNTTIISITNTHNEPGFEPASNQSGVVNVHFVYVDGSTWNETNRFQTLTPNDTFSVSVATHNPNSSSGFLYCVAWSPTGGRADLDYLVGDALIVDTGYNCIFGLPAVAFSALTGTGNPTDVNGNGDIDFDGIEYEKAGDQQIIRSFIGQGVLMDSYLAFVSLAGTADFETQLDLVVYNDNEQQFSSHFAFRCWAYVPLSTVGGVFNDSFLASTSTDPNSTVPFTTGWARVDGDRAVDTVGNEPPINDPMFVGACVQSLFGFAAAQLLAQTPQENPTAGILEY